VTFDVVVCSNRPNQLKKQVQDIRDAYPELTTIIVTSTRNYGFFRQLALQCIEKPFFLMLDDDITWTRKTIDTMLHAVQCNPDAIAAHPKLLFTNNTHLHQTLAYMNSRVVGGCCMFRTEHVRALGGYNVDMGPGEDNDLHDRAEASGYTWIKLETVSVVHGGTVLAFIKRKTKYIGVLDAPLKKFTRIMIRILVITPRIFIHARSIRGLLTLWAHYLIELLAFTASLRMTTRRNHAYYQH